jgi:hypothetical protein
VDDVTPFVVAIVLILTMLRAKQFIQTLMDH